MQKTGANALRVIRLGPDSTLNQQAIKGFGFFSNARSLQISHLKQRSQRFSMPESMRWFLEVVGLREDSSRKLCVSLLLA